MSPLALPGKRLFLILAGAIIVTQIAGVAFSVGNSGGHINWFKSVIQPLGLAVSVAFMWLGDNLLRWLVGIWAVATGALYVYVSSRIFFTLSGVTPPDAPDLLYDTFGSLLGILGLVGLIYVLAGLLLTFAPSLSAFFRSQREGIHDMEREDE